MNSQKPHESESNLRKIFDLLNQSCIDLPVERQKIYLPEAKQFIWQSLIAIDKNRMNELHKYIVNPDIFNKYSEDTKIMAMKETLLY